MARTIRQQPTAKNDPRHYFPTSKARKVERRSERRTARVDVRDYR
jgi:hypothetical protein